MPPPSKARPPIFALLLRAMLWTPVGLVIMIVGLAALVSVVMLPLVSLVSIYEGDYPTAAISLAATVLAFFIAKYIRRWFWETPDSLL